MSQVNLDMMPAISTAGFFCKGLGMKYRTLGKWDDHASCKGLVYFAQILDELLFDYSLDTYKSSVMQTGTLCLEALITIREIELGNIKAPNLNHVLNELASSFEKDEVAKSLVSLETSSFIGVLKNKTTKSGDVKTILEILFLELGYDRYKAKNEELLVAEISGRQDFAHIRRLARSYLTTLSWGGFSYKFIQEISLKFFHYDANRIGGPGAISDFLAKFAGVRKKYKVVFRGSALFSSISATCEKLHVTVQSKLPDEFESAKALIQIGGREVYVIVGEVEEKDCYTARYSAEERLRLAQTLFTLFHHKESPSWISECLVFSEADGECRVLQKPLNPMLKSGDVRIPVATARLDNLIQEFSLEDDSFSKFIRSAYLHSMALNGETPENQILNLWISLESLIPNENKADDVANIEHIVNSLVPFLNIGYMRSLFDNLVKDLLRWNYKETIRALRNVEGVKFHDKLARVLILPEYSANLARIEAIFFDFHLLSDRFCFFKNILSNPKNIVSALNAHKERLEWQIRRIYRVRNVIVHSGTTPPYTKQLIEHTHDYLDSVLRQLVRLASSPKKIESVGQGFKYVQLQYDSYLRNLSGKSVCFDKKNMGDLVFAKI